MQLPSWGRALEPAYPPHLVLALGCASVLRSVVSGLSLVWSFPSPLRRRNQETQRARGSADLERRCLLTAAGLAVPSRPRLEPRPGDSFHQGNGRNHALPLVPEALGTSHLLKDAPPPPLPGQNKQRARREAARGLLVCGPAPGAGLAAHVPGRPPPQGRLRVPGCTSTLGPLNGVFAHSLVVST